MCIKFVKAVGLLTSQMKCKYYFELQAVHHKKNQGEFVKKMSEAQVIK